LAILGEVSSQDSLACLQRRVDLLLSLRSCYLDEGIIFAVDPMRCGEWGSTDAQSSLFSEESFPHSN